MGEVLILLVQEIWSVPEEVWVFLLLGFVLALLAPAGSARPLAVR
jgi:hypothetical protein